MCGGGGSSGPTESTVTQTNLPDYAEPYYRDLLARTGYESAVPYQPYGGSRLKYFTPAEQTAMSSMNQLGVSGTPQELQAAGDIAGQIGLGNPYAGTMLEVTKRAQEMPHYGSAFQQRNVFSGYDPQYATNAGLMQRYMNPYTSLVTNPMIGEARRQSEISGQQLGLQAAGTGSLGGYREAIMQSERDRNLQKQISDIQGAGLQQAFGAATGAFQFGEQARQQAAAMGLDAVRIEQAGRIAEEQARANAVEMNYGQAQRAAQLGQTAYSQLMGGDQQRLAAAGMLGDFTGQRQQMELERLRSMQTSGQIERELLQRGLDIGYADFLRQQAYPRENLAFYSSMMQGVPIAPGQISQSYGITPSMTQQLLGSGIAGVGLYNAFR